MFRDISHPHYGFFSTASKWMKQFSLTASSTLIDGRLILIHLLNGHLPVSTKTVFLYPSSSTEALVVGILSYRLRSDFLLVKGKSEQT